MSQIEVISAVALGIALSASTGFRVFIPMLIASLASYFNWIPMPDGFSWLGSKAALITLLAASIVEVFAYYIPLVDNLLDTITTPLAIAAGTVLMSSALPVDADLLRWVTGFIVGGGAAATIQSGSVLSRLSSAKLTAGVGNPIVSTGENVAAVGSSLLSLFIPIIIALLFIAAGVILFFQTLNLNYSQNKNNAGQTY